MKKLLMASIILLLFSFSLLIFQTSCSKTSTAQSNNVVAQLNKIVYIKNVTSTSFEIWTANYDGSNQTQIPLTLPVGVGYDGNVVTSSLTVSPDGQTLFFTCTNPAGLGTSEIYTLPIVGGTPTLVVTGQVGKVHAY